MSTALSPDLTVARAASALASLRSGNIRVHAITSPVAAERTANTLLALGVRPSLTINPVEIADFVIRSDALLINLGMLDPVRETAIALACSTATQQHKPWVLDPVFTDVSGPRRQLALSCLALRPTVVKANAAEAAVAEAANPATVRVITGARDCVVSTKHHIEIANGHPLARQVTAAGCALGAIIAAFLVVEPEPAIAAAAALAVYGVAAELAADGAAGPASFGIRLIDALATLDGSTLNARARIT